MAAEVPRVSTGAEGAADRAAWIRTRHAVLWELLSEANSDDLRHQAAVLVVAQWGVSSRWGAEEYNHNPGVTPWVGDDGDWFLWTVGPVTRFRAFADLVAGAVGYAHRIRDAHPEAAALLSRGDFGWFARLASTGYPVRATVRQYGAAVLDVLQSLGFHDAPWSQAIGTAAMRAEQGAGGGSGGGGGSGSSGGRGSSRWVPVALVVGAAWLFLRESKRRA